MNTQRQELQGITQFELTKFLINNLQSFDITPAAKLVLLYLSTCYNPKNAEVFPKQKTISANLGISERSVVRSIAELIQKGLIISECGRNNRYRFTNAVMSKKIDINKMSDKESQNVFTSSDKLSLPYKGQKREQEKEHQEEVFNNISLTDYAVLKNYAIKHGAKNVNSYVKVLVKNGSYREILDSSKQAEQARINAQRRIKETQDLINSYKSETNYPEFPDNLKKRVEELKARLKK